MLPWLHNATSIQRSRRVFSGEFTNKLLFIFTYFLSRSEKHGAAAREARRRESVPLQHHSGPSAGHSHPAGYSHLQRETEGGANMFRWDTHTHTHNTHTHNTHTHTHNIDIIPPLAPNPNVCSCCVPSEISELADHGVTLPPNMQGLTGEQIVELNLRDEWEEKCVPSGGPVLRNDEIGRRNGHGESLIDMK